MGRSSLLRIAESRRSPGSALRTPGLGQRHEALDRDRLGPGRGSRPAASSSGARSAPSDFRLWRSILRRWPKAAAVTRPRSRRRRPAGAGARHELTTDDMTLGGGVKAEGGTSNRMRASRAPAAPARRAAHRPSAAGRRRRCARPPRAGTSASGSRTRAARARSRAIRSAAACRYCRAGWRRCGPAAHRRRASARQSVSSASPATTVEPAGIARRDLGQRRRGSARRAPPR